MDSGWLDEVGGAIEEEDVVDEEELDRDKRAGGRGMEGGRP